MKKILSAIISSPLKGRLGGVLFALLTTTTLFGQYYSPISVTDGTAADWDALPAEYVAFATHTEGCSYDGLKSVKVYCDDNYLNILVEVNLDVVTDREWTPFHIFLNADNSALTGGDYDIFSDADSEWMFETAIYQGGDVVTYNPAVFKWWGEVGGNGWQWTDPSSEHYAGDCWGAIVCENSDPAVGDAQMVDGDLSKVEIQILKERIPVYWANEFTIGVEIEQSWSDVGHLPNAADDEFGWWNQSEKLKVIANVVPQETLEGLSYKITSDVEPYTVEVSKVDKNLVSVNIPDMVVLDGVSYSVTTIGNYAFFDCSSLTSIAIPNSITNIGDYAFAGCNSLTSITIPNSITSIGDWAFAGCNSLTSITIPNSITSIGDYAFFACSSFTSIAIPNSITSIGDWAFAGCNSLTSITIPNSVISIGDYAFYNCDFLTSITIPNSVVSIGDYAFSTCYSLTSLICEASTPPTLGANVFPHISTIAVPCGAIEDYMASDWVTYAVALVDDCNGRCGDQLVWKYEDSQLNIFGEGDMYDYDVDVQPWQQYRNKITSISLPEGLTSVGNAGFKDCMFVNHVSVPASVETIGFSAFENCRMLSNLTFAANGALTIIDNWAFYNNHELKNVVIPEGVTSIGYAAFYGCTYLSELTLPASMQAIEDNGFALCGKLQRMNVDALVPPTVAARTFEEVNRSIPVYVPDEVVPAYQAAPVWQEFNIQGKSNAPSALDDISSPISNNQKLLRDGQLLILRDGKTYTIMGAEIH